MRKVATASLVGSIMEWYDFILYGTVAALVFNELFFPRVDPLIGTLLALATYGVGFASRPLGGIIFGHFGDRIGRKAALIVTILSVGLTTTLIGVLPTYEVIGIWAPILLLVLRFVQGLGFGGEYGGAALMTVEHAPRDRRGFWGSLPQAGAPIGSLISTAVLAVLTVLLSEQQFLAWGWRVPFLLSVLLLAVGLYVRVRILETPAFARVKEAGNEARVPLVDLVRRYPKNVLLTLGARFVDAAAANVFRVFGIAYVTTQLGLPRSVILTGVVIGAAVETVLIPIFGALSDRVGRRPIYMAGATFVGLMAFPYFWLLDTRAPVLIWLAVVVTFGLGIGLMFSVQATFFTELFGTRVRYSGVSLAYQLSGILGGLTPFIATALLAWAGDPWPVAAYLVVIAIIALACTYLLTETFQGDISESEEARLPEQPVARGQT